MSIAKITPEHAAEIFATGIQHMLLAEIKAKVKAFRDEVVGEIDAAYESACEAAAREAFCRVVEYHHLYEDKTELHIHFGEVK